MLTPPVVWLQRQRVPQILAVAISVTIAFLLIAVFVFTVASQLTQLAGNLPSYQGNIQAKIEAIKTTALSEGVFSRLGKFVEQIGEELSTATEEGSPAPDAEKPVRVQIEEPAPDPLTVIQNILGPLIGPLATAGIVVVLIVFILLRRQDLRDRFIRLAGAGELSKTTEAIEDAGSRVAQYLLMQLVVNVTYGIPVAVGLWWIGVPNALLWGMVATVLRFVPYVGPIVAATLPIVLAVSVDSGWTMVFWTVALFIVLELVSNNVVEPWLYGARTGISAFAIIIAAIFWTWLWGPIGLLLSTPLTVCLVVLGRHVPAFAFLDVLLGSEPVLSPDERLTQRLLAGDTDEATEIAEAYLTDHSLVSFYENVGLPSLLKIERDRSRGAIDADRRKLVAETMNGLIENLADYEDGHAGEESPRPKANLDAGVPREINPEQAVLCLGGKGVLDDAAAAIVAQLLSRAGVSAVATSLTEMSSKSGPLSSKLVCISYLAERSAVRARYLVKRLRRRDPAASFLLALWATEADDPERKAIVRSVGAEILDATLKSSLDTISANWRKVGLGETPLMLTK